VLWDKVADFFDAILPVRFWRSGIKTEISAISKALGDNLILYASRSVNLISLHLHDEIGLSISGYPVNGVEDSVKSSMTSLNSLPMDS
jgi:hypothetical protein